MIAALLLVGHRRLGAVIYSNGGGIVIEIGK